MRYTIDYDNESDGEQDELEAADIPLLGVEPFAVEGGSRATYDFPDNTTEDEILEALDESNWCFLSISEDTGSPEP